MTTGDLRPGRLRSFDPRAVGRWEAAAWVAYYRREWVAFLVAAVRLTRAAFGLAWPQTLHGAWLVLLANRRWAPYPDNDPAAARRHMRRLYRLLRAAYDEPFDPDTAAVLEVEWWRAHRAQQREGRPEGEALLVDALAGLYAHVYGVPADAVRRAAVERAAAMRLSDRWVDAGCDPDSPLVPAARTALVRSYAALLAAVHVLPDPAPQPAPHRRSNTHKAIPPPRK